MNIFEALKKAQLEFKPLKKTAINPFFHSKYATLDDCIDATREALAANNLVISQPTEYKDGILIVKTRLDFCGIVEGNNVLGIVSDYPVIPIKPDPQGYGSALTYARRYAYCSIIGLVADEDDDGNEGTKQPTKKPIQQSSPIQHNATLPPEPGSDPDEPPLEEPMQQQPAYQSAPAPAQPEKPHNVISEAQAKRLYAIAKGSGKTDEQIKTLIGQYGYKSTRDIDRCDYQVICDFVGAK